MTARKLYQELQTLGYLGSYESVNLIVRAFRRIGLWTKLSL